MRKITFISAYYENPEMLKTQLLNFCLLPKKVKENLDIIFVDDGSPDKPAEDVFKRLDEFNTVRLFRTLVDIRWNQDFCRNLAVSQAKTDWLFLTDIDHLVPEETLLELMTAEYINPTLTYKFGRVTAPDQTPYKPHPNTWFMTKDVYNRTGGYDERFAGYYGTDGDFASRVKRESEIVLLDKLKIIRVPREEISDASTIRYGRKEEQDKKIRAISQERKKIPNWKPLTLQAPWEEIQL